eukprot:1184372-Prorocentrum_minimum.AAC.1
MDQSDALSSPCCACGAGIFSRRTNHTQDVTRGYSQFLTTDQSTQVGHDHVADAVQLYSHEIPIGRRKRGYILTRNQSDAGGARPRGGRGAFPRRPEAGGRGGQKRAPLPALRAEPRTQR